MAWMRPGVRFPSAPRRPSHAGQPRAGSYCSAMSRAPLKQASDDPNDRSISCSALGANLVGLIIADLVLGRPQHRVAGVHRRRGVLHARRGDRRPARHEDGAPECACALRGGIALVTTLIGLIITDILFDGFSITGAWTSIPGDGHRLARGIGLGACVVLPLDSCSARSTRWEEHQERSAAAGWHLGAVGDLAARRRKRRLIGGRHQATSEQPVWLSGSICNVACPMR